MEKILRPLQIATHPADFFCLSYEHNFTNGQEVPTAANLSQIDNFSELRLIDTLSPDV